MTGSPRIAGVLGEVRERDGTSGANCFSEGRGSGGAEVVGENFVADVPLKTALFGRTSFVATKSRTRQTVRICPTECR